MLHTVGSQDMVGQVFEERKLNRTSSQQGEYIPEDFSPLVLRVEHAIVGREL